MCLIDHFWFVICPFVIEKLDCNTEGLTCSPDDLGEAMKVLQFDQIELPD